MKAVEINHAEYQRRVHTLPSSSLRYIIQDAREAIAANPGGPKDGYYTDEVLYCAAELRRRGDLT